MIAFVVLLKFNCECFIRFDSRFATYQHGDLLLKSRLN